jgi:hypothetical protein
MNVLVKAKCALCHFYGNKECPNVETTPDGSTKGTYSKDTDICNLFILTEILQPEKDGKNMRTRKTFL